MTESKDRPAKGKSVAGELVLVVDDDPIIRMGLQNALTDEGFAVLEASDSSDALRTLDDRRDIVVMVTDVDMPGTDGLDLALAAASALPNLKIIIITGHASVLDPRIPSGVQFMRKPVPLRNFAAWLRATLEAEHKASMQGA